MMKFTYENLDVCSKAVDFAVSVIDLINSIKKSP
jgi:hypothetical protein